MTDENKEALVQALKAKSKNEMDKEVVQAVIDSGNKILIADTYMKIRDVKNQINENRTIFQQKLNFMFTGTDDQVNILAARASEVTEEAIKNATFDQIKEFFMFDGKFIGLNTMPGLTDEDNIDPIAARKEISSIMESLKDFPQKLLSLLEFHIRDEDNPSSNEFVEIMESSDAEVVEKNRFRFFG